MYLNQEIEQPIERRVYIALSVVVCLALVSFGVQGYSFYQRIQAPSNTVIESAVVNHVADVTPAIPMTEVASSNLFGLYQEEIPAEPAPVLENLPETTLQLTLQGAFTHSDEIQSSAIISSMESHSAYEEMKGGHYYFINDILPGDAVLYAVNKDSVILKRGDVYETLHFPGYGTPIIDPTPHPQTNRISRVQETSKTSSSQHESVPREIVAVATLPNDVNHSEVRRSIQDRLARLRNE